MTQSSDEEALKRLEKILAEEDASGKPLDTSWTDDLPDDPLPEEDGDTSVTFLKKPK
jgi:hypothetical protein